MQKWIQSISIFLVQWNILLANLSFLMYYELISIENFSMRNAEITIELFLTIVLFRV